MKPDLKVDDWWGGEKNRNLVQRTLGSQRQSLNRDWDDEVTGNRCVSGLGNQVTTKGRQVNKW